MKNRHSGTPFVCLSSAASWVAGPAKKKNDTEGWDEFWAYNADVGRIDDVDDNLIEFLQVNARQR
jgi:hypothetical protein